MKPKLSPEQVEACELRDAVIEFAEENGWSVELKGCNKAFAFVKLSWGDEEAGDAVEKFQAFYSTDEGRPDKFMHTTTDAHGRTETSPVALDDVRALLSTEEDEEPAPEASEAAEEEGETWREHVLKHGTDVDNTEPNPVPPTDAAHTVPPIEGADAAHSAAHTDDDVPPIQYDLGTIDVPVGEMPPIQEQPTFSQLDADQHKKIAQRAKKHHDDAAQVKGGAPGQRVASQQDTYGAIHDLTLTNPKRSAYSSLTSSELIRMAAGKTITWKNGFSGHTQSVDVTPANESSRYPLSITPSDMEEAPPGDDPRMLHFIEHHGGFRSVAVARLTAIR